MRNEQESEAASDSYSNPLEPIMKIEQPGAIIQSGIASKAAESESMHADIRLPAGGKNPPSPQTAQVKQEQGMEKEATLIAGSSGSSLEFSVDADTNRIVVKVVDNETRELVRQIPMEEMLALAKAMNRLQGLLLRTKA